MTAKLLTEFLLFYQLVQRPKSTVVGNKVPGLDRFDSFEVLNCRGFIPRAHRCPIANNCGADHDSESEQYAERYNSQRDNDVSCTSSHLLNPPTRFIRCSNYYHASAGRGFRKIAERG